MKAHLHKKAIGVFVKRSKLRIRKTSIVPFLVSLCRSFECELLDAYERILLRCEMYMFNGNCTEMI